MLTLAIDTSGPVGSIALFDDALCLEERPLQLGRQHGQSLIPELKQLLTDHQRQPGDCGLVAVSIGPGSFTGLRVGIVCAKTMAYATGCRIAGVETLLAIAHNSPIDVSHVTIVCDAQRGDVFLRHCRRGGTENWGAEGDIEIVAANQFAETLTPDAVLSGPGLEKLSELFQNRCRLLPAEFWQPRASRIARLGMERLDAGTTDTCWSVEPLYLRKSSAEDNWEKRRKMKC